MRHITVLPSNMTGAVAVEAQTDHAFARHIHEQFGVGLVEQGAQMSLSGRGVVEATAGDIITVNPGEVHDGIPVGGRSRAWRMLYFDPEVVTGLVGELANERGGRDEFHRPVLRDHALTRLFPPLFAAITQPDPGMATLQQEALFVELIGALLHEGAMSTPDAFGVYARLRDRMADDPATSLTLEDLARESGLSRFQVVRGFKQAFGLAPHAYLIQCRLNRARRLIESGAPLAEVATASGFADQSHMTRLFVRHFGATPGAFGRARR